MNEENRDLYDEGEILETVKRFNQMVKDNDVFYFDVFELEAVIDHFMDEGRLSMAEKAIETGLQLHPSALNILLKKAQLLAYQGKPEECLQLIRFIEKVESSNHDVFLIKGSAYCLLGNFEKAIIAYEHAIHLNVDEKDDFIYNIGMTLGQTGEIKLAIQYLMRAHQINPRNELVLYELAYYFERDLQPDKSAVYYNKYLDIDPFNSSVWYNLGITYNHLDKPKKAIEAYDFALALNENLVQAYFNKANTYSNNEQFSEAAKAYEEYIIHEDENDEAFSYLAECYYNLNQLNAALVNYQKATQLNDQNSGAWFGAALVVWQEEKYEKCRLYLKKALVLEHNNDEYWMMYANVCKQLNRYNDAISAYQKATTFNPEKPEYWIAYSELLYETGDSTQAIELLKRPVILTNQVHTSITG